MSIRVTIAGRNAIIPAAAGTGDARVTIAGRNAPIPAAAGTGSMRVTQAGRNAPIPGDESPVRVTQMGLSVLALELKPNAPLISNPITLNTYALQIIIVHAESTDPLGGTITYTAQYRLNSGPGAWNTIFSGRSGFSPYVWDVSGLADADYDIQVWATATGGTGKESSASVVLAFTVDNTSPSAPNITAPYEDQEWTATNPQRVEWDAATDPNDLPLTYKIDYRAVGAGSWTPVTTGLTTLYYDWDVSAFAADDYEVRVYANNGSVDGPADVQTFTITAADRPVTPAIRIQNITNECITVELTAYDHPTPRDWASTTYVVYPIGGAATNPVISYTTTDPDEQSNVTLCGLPEGFRGYVFAYYTDNAANDSLNSEVAELTIIDPIESYGVFWDTDGVWSGGGPGQIQGRNNLDKTAQEPTAAVLEATSKLGSAYVSGYCMEGGANLGFTGRDTELRRMGIGIFDGYRQDNTWQGISAHLDIGIGSIGGTPGAFLAVEVRWPDGTYTFTYVDVGEIMIRYVAGYTSTTGSPIGDWTTGANRDPWYRIELLVNRCVSPTAPTTRIRAKVHPAVGNNVDQYTDPLIPVAEDDWHIDITYNKLGPCGYPGFVFEQLVYGFESAVTYFRSLEYRALRDDCIASITNVGQPLYNGPAGPGECTPVSEDALPTPVFFPIPPNGDVTEGIVYPTDVIETWDDSEQRISLRERARLQVGWTGTVLSSEEHTDFMAILYEEQPSRWIVPMWMDAAPLLANLGSSASSIPAASVDTEGRRFERMTHVALWVDQFTYHVTEAVLENDGSITLTNQTTTAFSAGPTYVLPCRVGRMPQSLSSRRTAPFAADTEFQFILEGVND